MTEIILILIGVLLGLLLFPEILHRRMRLNSDYDGSNRLNTYRLIWVLAMRRVLLSQLTAPDGSKPLSFVSHDETINTGI